MESRRLSIAIVCALSSYGGLLTARPADVQTYPPDDRTPDKTSSSAKGLSNEVCAATDANGLNACRPNPPMRALTAEEIQLIAGANMETIIVTAPVVDPPPIGGIPGGGGGGGGGGSPGGGGSTDPQFCVTVLDSANRTDADYVYGKEGGIETTGYTLPVGQFPNSGVTIGAGVDLGQQSATGLQALGVAQNIIDAVSPYLGLKGQSAYDALAANGLVLSSDDATALSAALFNHTRETVRANFAAASLDIKFDQLPAAAQTVIVDVAYPNGPYLANSAPNFWGQIITSDWSGAEYELENWYGEGSTNDRYKADASMLDSSILDGELPSLNMYGPCRR